VVILLLLHIQQNQLKKQLLLLEFQHQDLEIKKKNREEEPFAFAAREFLRKNFIGKTAKITVLQTNTQTGRDYCIVKVDDENLASLLLQNGFAKLTSKKKY